MNHSEQKITRLQHALQSAYETAIRKKRHGILSITAASLLAVLAVLTGVESFAYLPAIYKTAAVAAAIGLSLLIGWYIHKTFDSISSDQFISRYLKSRHTDGENIQSALDLFHNSAQKSSVFYDVALKANLTKINPDDIERDLKEYISSHYRSIVAYRSLLFFAASGILFSLAVGFFPDATSRTAAFWKNFEQPNPFSYVVFPGSTTIEQGRMVSPEVEFSGESPGSVVFAYKTDVEEEFRERPMTTSGNSVFSTDELEVSSSIDYAILMDGFRSEIYRMDVQTRPRFEELTATIRPPEYTRLPEQTFKYPYSALNLYPGSTVRFSGRLNKSAATVQLISKHHADSTTFQESDSLGIFTTEIQPEKTDTLSFQIIDQDGLKNRNPFRTFLTMTTDAPPAVVIREPSGTVMENEPETVDILYQATDDFGLSEIRLRWDIYKAFVDEPLRDSRRLSLPENGRNTRISWDLSELDLGPRDEVRFRIRAKDNDAVSGGKWGESQVVTIKIPSMAEFFDEIDSRERDVQGELDEVSERFDQMEQEYDRFIERLRENPEGGFEEQEMLESVSEQQQDIDKSVEQMKEKFEELKREMSETGKVSEETQQSYRELQQLMEDLDDPELQEALRELREAMENMNPDQIEKALENVTFNEELYKERLERTKELFKKLKMNSDLDKLAKQYEDLSERMRNKPNTTLEQLDREMETADVDMEKLSDQLEKLDDTPPKDLGEELKNIKEQAQDQLKKIQQEMEQLNQDVKNELKNGSRSPTEQMEQQQQQISQQMQEEADKLKQKQSEMSGEQLQVNLLALQWALYTLLELSETQETLTKDVQQTTNRSAGFVELARRQSYISNQFSAVADTLFQISSEIPSVPNLINKKKAEVEQTLGRAVEQMSERNQRRSSITSRESLGGINNLSSTIASLIDQLMNQQGGGSGSGSMSMQQMIEQMQKMSGEQQQINQQLQEMVNDMQGNRLSREQSDRLDELARQQKEIRRQIQELQRSGALQDGDEALSELQRMIDDMEDSINDMRGGVTDNLMIERQQNILSKMLRAEEAMEQRGETKEREGSSADSFDSELPPDMTLEELQQEIRSRLQDPNYTRFRDEHQRLIERYFEMLRRMEDQRIQ